jgi:hypothetical protein
VTFGVREKHILFVGSFKKEASCDQVEEHRAKTKDVTLCSIALVSEHFWGNITRGPTSFKDEGLRSVWRGLKLARETEICNLYIDTARVSRVDIIY